MLQRGRDPKTAETNRWCKLNTKEVLLQRGRDPKTAETWVWYCYSPVRYRLQRGRDPKTAETYGTCQGQVRYQEASTGPRSKDRGDINQRERYEALLDASTGPRSKDRGDSRAIKSLPGKTLQARFGEVLANRVLFDGEVQPEIITHYVQRSYAPERSGLFRPTCVGKKIQHKPRGFKRPRARRLGALEARQKTGQPLSPCLLLDQVSPS